MLGKIKLDLQQNLFKTRLTDHINLGHPLVKLSIGITGFETMNEVQLKITNLLGQVIYQEILTDKTHKELNLSGRLNEAVYFISIESGENKLVKKLMVK